MLPTTEVINKLPVTTVINKITFDKVKPELGFKSKCRVRCISYSQIGDKEIRDKKDVIKLEST